eukprot:1092387_1
MATAKPSGLPPIIDLSKLLPPRFPITTTINPYYNESRLPRYTIKPFNLEQLRENALRKNASAMKYRMPRIPRIPTRNSNEGLVKDVETLMAQDMEDYYTKPLNDNAFYSSSDHERDEGEVASPEDEKDEYELHLDPTVFVGFVRHKAVTEASLNWRKALVVERSRKSYIKYYNVFLRWLNHHSIAIINTDVLIAYCEWMRSKRCKTGKGKVGKACSTVCKERTA